MAIRTIVTGLLFACVVLACAACESGSASNSATEAGVLFQDEEKGHSHPPTPPSCKCVASLPSLGTLCIASHVIWKQGYLDSTIPNKKTTFWRAEMLTADGKKLSMVAGSISATMESDPEKRGLVPPGVVGFQPGLAIEHCEGGRGTTGCSSEVSTLRGGFVYAEIQPTFRYQPRWLFTWPFIIRTPAIPAGAYSGRLVLLTVPSGMGGDTLREVVYRPNQDTSNCDLAHMPDASPNMVVLAQPKDGPVVHIMSTPMMYEITPLGAATAPSKLNSEDERFLREVCAFVKRVRMEPMPSSLAKTDPCTR